MRTTLSLDEDVLQAVREQATREGRTMGEVLSTAVPEPVSPAVAVDLLDRATSTELHEFWPCDLSLLDPAAGHRDRLHGPRQVTDAYLLALATARGGRLVTFDRSVVLSAVQAATAANLAVL